MFGDHVTLLQSFQITFIAMSMVFVVLFIISLVLSGLSYIFNEKETKEQSSVKKSFTKDSSDSGNEKKISMNLSELLKDEEQQVAAMVATMEAAGENRNSNFRVTSIREL